MQTEGEIDDPQHSFLVSQRLKGLIRSRERRKATPHETMCILAHFSLPCVCPVSLKKESTKNKLFFKYNFAKQQFLCLQMSMYVICALQLNPCVIHNVIIDNRSKKWQDCFSSLGNYGDGDILPWDAWTDRCTPLAQRTPEVCSVNENQNYSSIISH
jgi:hypothetical protein